MPGPASGTLADAIAARLGVTPVPTVTERFPDGELRPAVDDVGGDDVYVVQATAPPVNEHLVELLLLLDATRRAHAGRVTAVIPYFGYARQDRRSGPGQAVAARVVADAIATAGAHRVVLVDAATGGGEPGTLYHLRGEDVAGPPPPGGLDVHRFRWDHALALARLLLGDGHPEAVDVHLVEAAAFEPGAEITPAVSDAVDRLVHMLLQDLGDEP